MTISEIEPAPAEDAAAAAARAAKGKAPARGVITKVSLQSPISRSPFLCMSLSLDRGRAVSCGVVPLWTYAVGSTISVHPAIRTFHVLIHFSVHLFIEHAGVHQASRTDSANSLRSHADPGMAGLGFGFELGSSSGPGSSSDPGGSAATLASPGSTTDSLSGSESGRRPVRRRSCPANLLHMFASYRYVLEVESCYLFSYCFFTK